MKSRCFEKLQSARPHTTESFDHVGGARWRDDKEGSTDVRGSSVSDSSVTYDRHFIRPAPAERVLAGGLLVPPSGVGRNDGRPGGAARVGRPENRGLGRPVGQQSVQAGRRQELYLRGEPLTDRKDTA